MKSPLSFLFLLCFSLLSLDNYAQSNAAEIRETLQSQFFTALYKNTYNSLLGRITKNGYMEESLTGAYEGMYCRTTGPMVALLIETNQLDKATTMVKCVLDATRENNMERIPHVIAERGNGFSILSDEHQIDGQAHVVLAWARLALKKGVSDFENDTWPQVRDIMNRTVDRTFFQHGWWSVEPGLVRNISFEHSREGRRWDAWDLLTQSFVGAALKDMSAIAMRRGDTTNAASWQKKLLLLQQGVRKNLTTIRHGDTTYLEMRLPDSDRGKPYLGMGWVTLSPVAAEWEPLAHSVMVNTVASMGRDMLQKTNGIVWMPTDSYPDGTVSNEIIGKGMGWELDFARQELNYTRIKEILDLIKIVDQSKPIYMEGGWLDKPGIKQSQKLSAQDLATMTDAIWKIKDAGNGEQCAWWCWAIARLRKSVGLTAMPK